ncbi:PTS sugar transporter subunit IIA [Salisediminibacterium beveridgei]|uniref:Mannitol-specific phosphotransferase enzyme IIA component n=1 Tax=Salisediminibacterium beveridgei TaxID=632773 RepID=A0A1D7QZ34_9BACI|nr:PTS sugar transporter subunit IIA [Salisediminibacterium beveridgei]AOM84274.1 PTS system, mannitol-specific IIA component [Salisediminibacterium beveridgei]
MTTQVITPENIRLKANVADKEAAIRIAGEILVNQGYVLPDYVGKMFEREELTSTFMGNYIAIPHGTEDAKEKVLASGISILQLSEPLDYGNGNIVKVVFGIAGKNNEHLDILSKIAIVCSDEANIDRIVHAETEQDLMAIFEEVND